MPRTGPRVNNPITKDEVAGPLKINIDRSSLEVEEDWVDDGRGSVESPFTPLNNATSKKKTLVGEKDEKKNNAVLKNDKPPSTATLSLDATDPVTNVAEVPKDGDSTASGGKEITKSEGHPDDSNASGEDAIRDSNGRHTTAVSVKSMSSTKDDPKPTKSKSKSHQNSQNKQQHPNGKSKKDESSRTLSINNAAASNGANTTPHKPSPLRNSAISSSDEGLAGAQSSSENVKKEEKAHATTDDGKNGLPVPTVMEVIAKEELSPESCL